MNKLWLILTLIIEVTALTSLAVIGHFLHETKSADSQTLTEEQETVIRSLPVDKTIENLLLPTQPSEKRLLAPMNSETVPVVVLGAKNTLVLRGPVTESSIAKLQKEFLDKAAELSPSDVIYLAIDTPGGSVDAGNSLIELTRGLRQKVKTVTFFAASMGFQIVEALDERLIVSTGTLMSHRMKIDGIGGELPGNLVKRINWLLAVTKEQDGRVAARLGMSLADYQELIRDEWWVTGKETIEAKAADRAVIVRCAKDLNDTEIYEFETVFGKLKAEFSKCPLMRAPFSVDSSNLVFPDRQTAKAFEEFFREAFFDQEQFVRNYVKANQISVYLK